MRIGDSIRMGVILGLWGVSIPSMAFGQIAPAPTSPMTPASPSAAMMNPYLNPLLNPYINPGAAQQPISARNAALYMYSAQAANGGFGSGRLSGSRAGAAAPAPAKAAEMPNSSSVPGGGASRYFNPGPVNVNGAGRYYNRRSRYFQSNGR